jgi:hypothetical protein
MHSIGPYERVRPLGRGAGGEVWEVLRRDSGARYALKRWTGGQEGAVEVELTARLDHPHIIAILDVQPAADCTHDAWCVYELMAGSLRQALPLSSWDEARDVLIATLRALAHAHSFGVLHRDIKPDNILRGHDGVWRICDFGVAAWTGMETSPIVGSPHYMAPEQVTGSLLLQATWTDLYAVGCVGWELVTGAPPFQGATHQDVFRHHLQTEPPPFTPQFDVPEGLELWLRALMNKNPFQRPELAADALAALWMGRFADALEPASTWSEDSDLSQDYTIPPAPPTEEPDRAAWEAAPHSRRPRLRPFGFELAKQRMGFVGRQAERWRLWKALVAVERADAPAVVAIRGDGLGASALGHWLIARAVETGMAFGLGFEGRRAHPIAHRWRKWLQPAKSPTEARTYIRGLIPGVDPEDAAFIADTGTALDDPRWVPCTVRANAAKARRPIVLFLDDVGESDALRDLARQTLQGTDPVLVVLTGVEDLDWLETDGIPTGLLDLEPLTGDEWDALFVGLGLDAPAARQLRERTDGRIRDAIRALRKAAKPISDPG